MSDGKILAIQKFGLFISYLVSCFSVNFTLKILEIKIVWYNIVHSQESKLLLSYLTIIKFLLNKNVN